MFNSSKAYLLFTIFTTIKVNLPFRIVQNSFSRLLMCWVPTVRRRISFWFVSPSVKENKRVLCTNYHLCAMSQYMHQIWLSKVSKFLRLSGWLCVLLVPIKRHALYIFSLAIFTSYLNEKGGKSQRYFGLITPMAYA